MTNEEFQKIVLEKLGSLEQSQSSLAQGQKSLEQNQNILAQGQKTLEENQRILAQGQKSLEQNQEEMGRTIARIENDQGNKIAALFDGYTLRGEEIEKLRDHLDERLDSIQTDLSYVVSKVAQHDRNIIKLNKKAE